jgi:ferredoxin
MKSITRQKPFDEIVNQLHDFSRIFIAGCGTCAAITHTGGVEEVAAMKDKLQSQGKFVTGSIVIPVACDDVTEALVEEHQGSILSAHAILMMSCALGVHRMSQNVGRKPVVPALDTLFIGMDDGQGVFHEVCAQCGQCLLGEMAGICPITACHKGLLNGPCGGTNNGKCEIDKEKDCAWTLIYNRLKEQNRLDMMRKYQPPKNYQAVPRPRLIKVF